MKKNRLLVIAAMLVFAICAMVPVSYAGSVTFESGEFYKDMIGWDGTYPATSFDIVDVGAKSGSFTLSTTSQVMEINDLQFEVGLNAASASTNSFNIMRTLTVNGHILIIYNPASVVIGTSDTLNVLDGPSVYAGGIMITPLGWESSMVVYQAGTTQGSLLARFTQVPEPASMLLLGLGLVGLGIIRRKHS